MMESIVLGGGCFWCVEAVLRTLRGVEAVTSGYAGGAMEAPTYEQVCSGLTGHAEVVKVTFDPAVLSRADLLRVFFMLHDPTTPNRQGHDVGTQYRSAVFWTTAEQKRAVEEVMTEVGRGNFWAAPLVTQVAPLDVFWPAEAKHEDYFSRNGGNPYCQAVVAPKVAKMKALFAALQK